MDPLTRTHATYSSLPIVQEETLENYHDFP